MDRTIMEDYYDQKYGENMEKNPWEKSPEYQELLEKQTRIEDAIRGLLGNENHRVWQLYEDAMSVQFAMEEVGIKYMYLRGAEDRERKTCRGSLVWRRPWRPPAGIWRLPRSG